MSTSTPKTLRNEAYEAGAAHAKSWATLTVKSPPASTIASWRAIGYANTVLLYERELLFMELLTEWERGFTAVEQANIGERAASVESSLLGTAVQKAMRKIAPDAQFKNIDRAPYELQMLLRRLPAEFLTAASVTQEDLEVAVAARRHAENANTTLMRGLEALGKVMSVAGDNEEDEIDSRTVVGLGGLLQHIAAEARFLQETENYLAYAFEVQADRFHQKNGGGHA